MHCIPGWIGSGARDAARCVPGRTGGPAITPRNKGQDPRPCGFNERSEDNNGTDDNDHLNADRDDYDYEDKGSVYMAVTNFLS